MFTLFFVVSASCPNVKIINQTDNWSRIDKLNLQQATKHCSVKYRNSPCLKVFIKKEKNLYRAICGQGE